MIDEFAHGPILPLISGLVERERLPRMFSADVEASLEIHFPAEERGLLGHVIPTGPEVEMPIRLLGLLKRNAELMGPLIEDFPQFVRSLSDTLAFIGRRVEAERPPLQGVALLHAVEKVRMLIKIVILEELGFNPETVEVLIERNQRFNYLKTV